MPFHVRIDDNFHYMDESARLDGGTFDTYEVAEAKCKKIVDEWLAHAYKKGMAQDELMKQYVMFGDDPFIVPTPEGKRFSAREYARERAAAMCGKG